MLRSKSIDNVHTRERINMMKNKYIAVAMIAQLISTQLLHADHIITFFIRPYPYAMPLNESTQFINKLHKPGKLAKNQLKKHTRFAPTAGIFCSYGGFMDISNRAGQVIFPRKHEEPSLNIVIANRIYPILMAANTIHHWEIMPNTPSAHYSIQQEQDPETNLWYWSVEKAEAPQNNIVPAKSILIFAKPKNFFVPEGITPTTNNANLVLPTVYSKKSMDIVSNALFALAIRQFFSSGKSDIKQSGKTYQINQEY